MRRNDQSFEVHPYSIEQLSTILADKSISNPDTINKKIHLAYFNEYFAHLETKTILVENHYIDRDFLEDHASYYIRCFYEYKKKCTRLHFFKIEFTPGDVDDLLTNGNRKLLQDLQQNYLGFIVIRPLPLTIIGRTCLVTYPPEDGIKRIFPILRDYDVHLFGLNLKVNSLGFQEQDNVVAACATSALWSVFHRTGVKFQHPIWSPVEITKTATKLLPMETRTFPNKGLAIQQMAQAIRGVNLEPLLVNVFNNEYQLKSFIYAYLRDGIPVIFGFDLYGIHEEEKRLIGNHAVAVVGYRIEDKSSKEMEKEDVKLISSKISKIYVHDDQIGPFSRMSFDSTKVKLSNNESENESIALSTSWEKGNFPTGSVKAVPSILLVPLYHKIRIPFDIIHQKIRVFNSIIEDLKENIMLRPYHALTWDIYLIDADILKKEILHSENKGEYFKNILLANLPKYIWRATALRKDKPIIDFLFDATDIEQGQYFLFPIEYDPNFSYLLHEIFKSEVFEKLPMNNPVWGIIHWFRENLSIHQESV